MSLETIQLLPLSEETTEFGAPKCDYPTDSAVDIILERDEVKYFISCLNFQKMKKSYFGGWNFELDNSSKIKTELFIPTISFFDKKIITDQYLIPKIREEKLHTLMPSHAFTFNIQIELVEKSKPPIIERE